MTKLFEFHFLDIYNEEYVISIYDSESDVQGEIKTAKLYGQDGFILSYEKENVDIVQGGIIKSDVTFSVVNEGGILDNFLKNLQIYENRYLVDIFYNERLFWRGIMLNDYITFDDSKIQVIKFSCTDGLGLLQNIDYTDDISKLDSTAMQFDSDAYGNGLIDVISRALSFNPITKFFSYYSSFINFRTDYIADEMLNNWDALVYTNILKHKADTTLLTTPFADYTIKETLAGNRLKVYEYKNCYDVINECLKVFNLCLCQRYGVWYIFNIRDFEKNKNNFLLKSAYFNNNNYYKNLKYKELEENFGNSYYAIGGTNSNKRGSGEFGLNTVVKKIEQKYVPYYVKEGTFNNLIYSGNHGGDLQWYSYPAGVITGISNGNVVYEANFNNWNLCSKYHYHNELDIFTAMTKLQFLINFAIKYTLDSGSGYVHTSMIKPKMDLNLQINGKWLDTNGNWVDNLPSGNWWHKFTGVFDGNDRVVNVNFNKYFDLQIPNQSIGKLSVDFYFRIYTETHVVGILPWNFKITNIDNNSVLKLVDNNGNDIESIDYVVENDSGILDLELEQAFIDNFSESEENNVLFTAVQDLGLNSYRYKKSKKWRHSDETNYYNLVELRLREIAAMNNHPLLNWQGTIYYDSNSYISYMMFYLIKYNLTTQNYVMFPQRWTFYARKKYAEADLIEVSKDFVRVISGNDLAIADFNLPMVPINSGTGTIVTADEGVAIVPANRINLSANNTVNEIINVSRQNGSTDFIVEYDEDNQEINWKNDTDTLLKITNDGISYKNEKGAGNGIDIDINNKINANIDNNTIKIDGNNKLYADLTNYFTLDKYLKKTFITYLEKFGFYVNLKLNTNYNLLTALTERLLSDFMEYTANKININLLQLQNYLALKTYIEHDLILDLEHKDSIFITYQNKIYIFNYTDSTFTLIYTQPDSYTLSDLYYCKESTYYNTLPTLYFIANGTLWNLEKGDTTINCTKFIIYNHDIFVFYDGTITRYDIYGQGINEATGVNVDGFFAEMGTIFYWDTISNETYIRKNGVWELYLDTAIKKLLFYENEFIRISYNDVDGCILKNKLFIFKSDGIYLYIWGNIYLLDYNISNITHVSCTEDYAYIYADTDKLYKFDGDILTEIGSYDISEILAVSTKDTKFSIAESGIDDNLQFGNNSQSMLLEKYHGDTYEFDLQQNDNYFSSLYFKKLAVKSEIKHIFNFAMGVNPDDISGLKIWLKADYGVVKDANNKVSAWHDASGNGYIFNQSNPDKQPLYIPSIDSMNYKPAIEFQNDELQCWQEMSIGTIFVVANYSHDVFQTYAGLFSRAVFDDTQLSIIFTGDAATTNLYYAPLLENNIYINNTQTYNFAPLPRPKICYGYMASGTPYTWPDAMIGRDRYGTNRFWEGDVYELIIYYRVLDTTEIEQVKTYLKNKYNMTF